MLTHCFPDTRIISVEFEKKSPRAAVALKKLAPYPNVECLFGDSRDVLPRYLERGDPVLIDGPKEFRALKLGLRLLHTRKPSVVFMHDFGRHTMASFLDRAWPGAFSAINRSSCAALVRSMTSARRRAQLRLLVYRRICPASTRRY